MKTLFLLLALMVHNAPEKVEIYDKYEVSFTLGQVSNPYDPEVIDVYADFTAPDGRTFRVIGFYYEGYSLSEANRIEVATRLRDQDCWKVRFTPDLTGRWTYVIHAKDRKGEQRSQQLAFDCMPKDEASGFVRTANRMFLKREVVAGGQKGFRSFFPVGPNVAWYRTADYNKFKKPFGVYEYQYYIDALSGNANYLRVWACRYQYLSLYGPEHAIRDAEGRPTMYFDATLNQKDAAELDYIVSHTADHGLQLMLCFFNNADLRDDSEALESSKPYGSMPSGWQHNPYHTILGLERPVEFFSDPRARRVTRNLLRYFVARWGYATNLMCWELFNEVSDTFKGLPLQGDEKDALINWHNEMAALIRSVDAHQHLISTSTGNNTDIPDLNRRLFDSLDLVQDHNYQNLQKAMSRDQMSHKLFLMTNKMREAHPDKPCFMGEYGLTSRVSGISNTTKDPKGVDLHNCLWSSLFSGAVGPGSFWYWRELRDRDIFDLFKPVTVFSNSLPMLSGTFTAKLTGEVRGKELVFPNGLATYYLANADADTLMGWCQDTAFCYQALRRLTDQVGQNGHFVDDGVFDPEGYIYTLDPAKRPRPSSRDNRIVLPVNGQPRGTKYQVQWFDAETGLELVDEAQVVAVRKPWFGNARIVVEMPASIRDVEGRKVNNTFGDAVFVITCLEGR